MQESPVKSKLGVAIQGMVEQALSREKLELAVRTLARVVQAVLTGDRVACARAPRSRLSKWLYS